MTYSRIEKAKIETQKNRYSMRKSAVYGLASVILGSAMIGQSVLAAETTTSSITSTTATTITTDSSTETSTTTSNGTIQISEPVSTENSTVLDTQANLATSTEPVQQDSEAVLEAASQENTETASPQESTDTSEAMPISPVISEAPVGTESSNLTQTIANDNLTIVPVQLAAYAAPQETVTTSVVGTKLTIVTNLTVAPTDTIKYAVWTDLNNQDDLAWYTADAQAAAYIDLSKKHRSYGLYNIHTYKQDSTGKMIGLDAKQITIPYPTATTTITKTSETSFDVLVTQVPSEITRLNIPVWSDVNGQDDLKWYQANPLGNGTFKLSVFTQNHKNDVGHYSVHLYGQSSITGTQVALGATEGYNQPIPPAVNTLSAQLSKEGIAISLTSNTVKDLSKVKFAVWSEIDGQNDLKWYSSTASGTAIAPYQNHTGYGNYFIHAYSYETGKAVGLATKTLVIAEPKVTASVEKVTDFTYKIVVSQVPSYITKIEVPNWSSNNGQDDIKWTSASMVSDGNYQAIINIGDHGFDIGHYNAHIYGYSLLEQKTVGLTSTSGFDVANLPSQTGDVIIAPLNNSDLTFKVSINNASNVAGIKAVKVAVWSDKDGQDDMQWLTATKLSGTSYQVIVDLQDHKFESGLNHVHVYYQLMTGTMSGVTAKTTSVSLPPVTGVAGAIDGLNQFVPSLSVRNLIASAVKTITDQGYQVGFTMFDAITKEGLSYNNNQKFYVASSIKGIYVASLVAQNPLAFNTNYTAIKNILYYSDNDAYANLRATYGAGYIANWMAKAGVDTSMSIPGYPYITSNELAKLWAVNYEYFKTNTTGQTLSKLYQNPNYSPIHSVLGSQYTTMSKAGWIGMTGYHAANDAGIVTTVNGDYIISITTNADGKLGLLNPLVSALNTAYKEI